MEQQEEVVLLPPELLQRTKKDAIAKMDFMIDQKSIEIQKLSSDLKETHAQFTKLLDAIKNKLDTRIPEEKVLFDRTKLDLLSLMERMEILTDQALHTRKQEIETQSNFLMQRTLDMSKNILTTLETTFEERRSHQSRLGRYFRQFGRLVVAVSFLVLLVYCAVWL
jgi:hypothetical protein